MQLIGERHAIETQHDATSSNSDVIAMVVAETREQARVARKVSRCETRTLSEFVEFECRL
jgi:hypothetical protein